MPLFAIIVEGSHDASFLGQLLKTRGFTAINKLSEVPEKWRHLFPRQFPQYGERLGLIMSFPEIFLHKDISVGIVTAGCDDYLVEKLQTALDQIGIHHFSGVALFMDIDKHSAAQRFQGLEKRLKAMNAKAEQNALPGYPIAIPAKAGEIAAGPPAVGIYLFPDNIGPGCLEDLLLACARTNHPHIADAGIALVDTIDTTCPADQKKDLKALHSGMGEKRPKSVLSPIS